LRRALEAEWREGRTRVSLEKRGDVIVACGGKKHSGGDAGWERGGAKSYGMRGVGGVKNKSG